MSQVTQPIILNSTGQAIAQRLQSIANALNGIPVLTRTEWDALTIAEKQAYNLVAIRKGQSAYPMVDLLYGPDSFYIPTLLTASAPANILAEALCENFMTGVSAWDNFVLVRPVALNVDGSVDLGIGNCAYYNLSESNTQCTVYAVMKQTKTVGYNATALSVAYALSAGNTPNFFAPSGTYNLYTSLYGSDTATGYSLNDYVMLVMRVGANKSITYFVNDLYTGTKTANNSGQTVVFGAALADLTNDLPSAAKYLAVVGEAETNEVISANMQNIMAHYGIT